MQAVRCSCSMITKRITLLFCMILDRPLTEFHLAAIDAASASWQRQPCLMVARGEAVCSHWATLFKAWVVPEHTPCAPCMLLSVTVCSELELLSWFIAGHWRPGLGLLLSTDRWIDTTGVAQ